MTITTFDDVNRMFDEMDDSFDDLRRRIASPWWADSGRELIETDAGYAMVLDMPGFERDEIELTVTDGVLSVAASTESRTIDDDELAEGSLLTEVRSRQFDERVRLPESVRIDAIEASYRNGVLEVLLPTAGEDSTDVHIDLSN
jgi:HSP20 family protein